MRSFSAENPNTIEDSHRFGNFRFDNAKRVLWRNGELVYLPPRSADLLAVLLEHRGEVLERNELIDRVWQDTFVEEGNLNFTISILRKALGLNENGEKMTDDNFYLIFNAYDGPITFTLPEAKFGDNWRVALSTMPLHYGKEEIRSGTQVPVEPRSFLLLQCPNGSAGKKPPVSLPEIADK